MIVSVVAAEIRYLKKCAVSIGPPCTMVISVRANFKITKLNDGPVSSQVSVICGLAE